MSAREEIFAQIRRSLHVTGTEAPRRAAVADRLARTPSGVIPERGQGGLATFKEEALRSAATLAEVATAADIPAEIARFLREHNLPATLKIGADPRLAGIASRPAQGCLQPLRHLGEILVGARGRLRRGGRGGGALRRANRRGHLWRFARAGWGPGHHRLVA